ncbi:hypothetical protein L6164_035837 [Bauhinia variegata]|uniref:Uncharacterized protein n=1 Tax=Bauhinia variegata TaxID=167791 RepID=A0ACB9KF94_BAUVA|nr:hypothetical protein L6164_035837 [Bauhinia variegata]
MVYSPMFYNSIQVLLLCSLAFLSDVAFADPPYEICSSSSHANGSAFENNLKNLLLSLPSNASISKSYNASYGDDPDKVYGLYMCLDYISSESCQNCIATARMDIVKLCPEAEEAVVWEEECQLRYSNRNFFGKLNISENIGKDNMQNISEPEKFESAVNEILYNITEKAAFSPSANMYATREGPFEDKTIYALVQCTKDLSAANCSTCLKSAMTDIPGCCYASIGARILTPSCYLRYEFYPFYEGATGPADPSTSNSKGHNSGKKTRMIAGIVAAAGLAITFFSICIFCVMKNKSEKGANGIISHLIELNNFSQREDKGFDLQNFQVRNDRKVEEFSYIDLDSLCLATRNFSDSNKLGQGGFGPVYKGILTDGQEVAVKRLSTFSDQGTEEFINEVQVIMKLQHKNLVRLLGFCVDGEEKLLVYEFMPNGSLDAILFDPMQGAQLDWSKRLNIISGVAKGILYLHEDSRLKIIHRDLKTSNVLLDHHMNPKISDFGMARIFAGSEGEASTITIVGTYGYMAPEYAMEGYYSIKSDVFAFGVLLLEIISGKRNAGFYQSKQAPSLLAYAWHLRNEGKGLDFMDPLLADSCNHHQFLEYMHIGLLCVQEDAYDRPTMSSVVLMLQSESATLSQPERPPFFLGRFNDIVSYEPDREQHSVNGLTISKVVPR